MKKHIKKIAIGVGITIFGIGIIKYTKTKEEVSIEVPVQDSIVAIQDGVVVDTTILLEDIIR